MTQQVRALSCALLFAVWVSACSETSGNTPAVEDAAASEVDAGQLSLIVEDGVVGPFVPSTAHLKLRVSAISGEAWVLPLTPWPLSWPARFELPALPDGELSLTAFVDRDQDDSLDDCPYPPSAVHTESADLRDNLSGSVQISAGTGAAVIRMERRICGPGERATGIEGELNATQPVSEPVWVLIEPLNQLGIAGLASAERVEPVSEPLRVMIFPDGLSGTGSFSVGELVPGRYRLTFFGDADGDGSPSLCSDSGLGGGDRRVSVIEEVVVEAGTRTSLPAAVELGEAQCPELLTGVFGVIELDAALSEERANTRRADAEGSLLGAVGFAILEPRTGIVVAKTMLDQNLLGRPVPRPFAISGLVEGRYRVAIWIDADENEAFAPCTSFAGGLDSVFITQEDVTIRAGQWTDVGTLKLRQQTCEEGTTAIRGALTVEGEAGSSGSGRPVRIELFAHLDGSRLSYPLFELDAEVFGATPFAKRLDARPGRYQARVFVDTNRDGVFSRCDVSPFGDRAATELIELTVEANQVTDLGDLVVQRMGCDLPDTFITPSFIRAPELTGPYLAGPATLEVEEAGGYTQTLLIEEIESFAEETGELRRVELAPGRYHLSLTLGHPGPCGAEIAAVQAAADVVLDQNQPVAAPTLVLLPVCLP